jgi:hypothetical protein
VAACLPSWDCHPAPVIPPGRGIATKITQRQLACAPAAARSIQASTSRRPIPQRRPPGGAPRPATTGRVIIAAAIIMIGEFGIGLAAAVPLDAFVCAPSQSRP